MRLLGLKRLSGYVAGSAKKAAGLVSAGEAVVPPRQITTCGLKVSISLAWWFPLYVHGLIFFCVLMQTQPDQAKLYATVIKAMRIKVSLG